MSKTETKAKVTNHHRPNTLEHIQKEITKDLANGRPILVFKNKEALRAYLGVHFMQMVKHGQVSYDPTEGEVIVSFAPMDVFHRLPDAEEGMRISDEIKAFFIDEGWDDAVVIPHRTGVSKTLVSLRSKTLKAQELTTPPEQKVRQAVLASLQKNK